MRPFGTVIQEHAAPTAPALVSQSVLDRFADIVAYATGAMPEVAVRHCFTLAGRAVITIAVENGTVTTFEPATRGLDVIGVRSFTQHATTVGAASWTDLRVPILAQDLAQACGFRVGATEIETVDAIVAAVGPDAAEVYVDTLCSGDGEAALEVYAEGDLAGLLGEATAFAYEWAAAVDAAERDAAQESVRGFAGEW